jgi:hypothetical protein
VNSNPSSQPPKAPLAVHHTSQRNPPPPEAPPHVLLDAYLTAAVSTEGQRLRQVASNIAADLNPMKRQDAMQRRLEIITTLLANVIAASIKRPCIAIPLSNAKLTRYDRREIISAQLKPTVLELERVGLFTIHPAHFHKRRTVLEPKPKLLALLTAHHVTTLSLARAPNEELILLRRRKAKNNEFADSPSDDGEFIDYADSDSADLERNRMRRLNKFLASADVRIEGEDQPPPFKPFVRIFASHGLSETFALHGRLYRGQVGGWHQGLAKSERHRIRINGESVASIDFSSIHIHLAYAEAKTQVPEGDLYAIEGLDPIQHRPAVKIVMSAMLARKGDMKQLPHDARILLPKDWTASRIVAAIKHRHGPIANLFGIDLGISLMFRDSKILMATLEQLVDKKIVALPLHDAIIVQQSEIEKAKQVMQDVSNVLLGYAVPLKVERY